MRFLLLRPLALLAVLNGSLTAAHLVHCQPAAPNPRVTKFELLVGAMYFGITLAYALEGYRQLRHEQAAMRDLADFRARIAKEFEDRLATTTAAPPAAAPPTATAPVQN